MTFIRGLITPLMTTHEPPSARGSVGALRRGESPESRLRRDVGLPFQGV